MSFKLPPSLEPYRAEFEKTALDYIRITKASGIPELWQSKLGGHPYLPRDSSFPKDRQGKDLLFLAQINFEEIPHLEPFPTSGIVQFFINDDDLYGLDFDHPFSQQNFRVRYFDTIHKDTDKLTVDFSFLRSYVKEPYEYSPYNLKKSFKLTGELQHELVPMNDFHYGLSVKHIFKENFIDPQKEQIESEYLDLYTSNSHKMGGYACFTQEDPRTYDQKLQNLTLLFQLDTDESMEIMWGDVGIANFFIDPEKLKQKDFSEVLYNWDCC